MTTVQLDVATRPEYRTMRCGVLQCHGFRASVKSKSTSAYESSALIFARWFWGIDQ